MSENLRTILPCKVWGWVGYLWVFLTNTIKWKLHILNIWYSIVVLYKGTPFFDSNWSWMKKTGLLAEQYAPYTWFLSRPVRKELNVPTSKECFLTCSLWFMPSPFADSNFFLSIRNLLFKQCTQNFLIIASLQKGTIKGLLLYTWWPL